MRNGKALCFFVRLTFESYASLKQDALLVVLIQYSFNSWALIRSFKRIVSTYFKGNHDFNMHVKSTGVKRNVQCGRFTTT